MLERGDKKEDAIRRIENDRKIFAKGNIPKTNFYIDSENKSIEEVADEIYRLYSKHVKG